MKNKKRFFLRASRGLSLIGFLFLFSFCSYLEKSVERAFLKLFVPKKEGLANKKAEKAYSVTLKSEQVFEKNKSFRGFKVGGLSSLAFDRSSGDFYALSDDKKNHRFYKLSLSKNPPYKFTIKEQVFLKSQGHKRLKRNMDPEALAIYDSNLFVSSEGQQIYERHEPTQIFTFNRQAVLKKAWPVPPVFWREDLKGRVAENFGQQENKGFESLTLDKSSGRLWTATEEPLKQDLIFGDQSFVRLSAFDIQNQKMQAQYAYPLHDSGGGLTALQLVEPKLFISLERVYKKEKKAGVNEVYIFLTDCQEAENIQKDSQLKRGLKACSKTLLWDSSKAGIKVDNMEGLALGPVLPLKDPAERIEPSNFTKDLQTFKKTASSFADKRSVINLKKNQRIKTAPKVISSLKTQLMVLVSDNNFNEEQQKSQFLFFELNRPQ